MSSYRIAFFYDKITKFGGAERILTSLSSIWPDAPIFTTVYNKKNTPWTSTLKIIPSYVQTLPFASAHPSCYSFLSPLSSESLSFDEYNIVISITSSYGKRIVTKPGTLHICYCLTPTRYLWSGFEIYVDKPGFSYVNPLARTALRMVIPSQRRNDFIYAQRPDSYIAISQTVSQRIRKYYKRESSVVYPPVNTQQFSVAPKSGKEDYFLIVSRLVPYKRIDYAIDACNILKKKLIIIGDGIDRRHLMLRAGPTIQFLTNRLTDEQLAWYYQNSLCLIFPGEEDFGITAVEAQSCGKPVLGLKKGGLEETVIPGVTGEMYESAHVRDLAVQLKRFNPAKYSSENCRGSAARFAETIFKSRIRQTVELNYENYRKDSKKN